MTPRQKVVSRSWHLVPFGGGLLFGLFLFGVWNEELFGNTKDRFETIIGLVGLVAIPATFIEILRAASLTEVLDFNLVASNNRKRAGEMARVIQELRTAIDLVDTKSPLSARTASDLAGLLRSLYPKGLKLDSSDTLTHEDYVSTMHKLTTQKEREAMVDRLGRIRVFIDGELSSLNGRLDRLHVGGGQ